MREYKVGAFAIQSGDGHNSPMSKETKESK